MVKKWLLEISINITSFFISFANMSSIRDFIAYISSYVKFAFLEVVLANCPDAVVQVHEVDWRGILSVEVCDYDAV